MTTSSSLAQEGLPVLAAAGSSGGSPVMMFVLLGLFGLIFYFMIFRPQSKRRKEHQALVGGLSKGDEIVTAGGIAGVVTQVEDDFVKLSVANNVVIRMQKSSIGATLPKGTLKSLDEKK